MIYRVDKFVESAVNPLSGGAYDDSWIVLTVTDTADYQMMCGSFNGCAYTLKVSRCFDGWETAVGDFLGFYEMANKNIIAALSEQDLSAVREKYGELTYCDPFLRVGEPEVLVHSTTLENWASIQSDGALKSWNLLKKSDKLNEREPIGRQLGDPADFSDFIMFSGGHIAGELVVCSKQAGQIIMDENAAYQTGARLYFDCRKIAADGLLLRDGAHLKVRDSLPLEPYLLWAATWETVGLPERLSTPKIFTERANRVFTEKFNIQIG